LEGNAIWRIGAGRRTPDQRNQDHKAEYGQGEKGGKTLLHGGNYLRKTGLVNNSLRQHWDDGNWYAAALFIITL
jgi:hypothetical protein